MTSMHSRTGTLKRLCVALTVWLSAAIGFAQTSVAPSAGAQAAGNPTVKDFGKGGDAKTGSNEAAADALGLPTRQVARFLCSSGETLALTRKLSKGEIAGNISRAGASASDAVTQKNVRSVRDAAAAEAASSGREVNREYQLAYKYRNHTLKLDRTNNGLEFVDRTWGLAWQEKAGRGTLRNIHSGRILAKDCRPGIAQQFKADGDIQSPSAQSN